MLTRGADSVRVLVGRLLARFHAADAQPVLVEGTTAPVYIDLPAAEVSSTLTNGDHNGNGNGKHAWSEDRLTFRPLHDRGGPVAVYHGPSGPLGELAKLELDRRAAEYPQADTRPSPT